MIKSSSILISLSLTSIILSSSSLWSIPSSSNNNNNNKHEDNFVKCLSNHDHDHDIHSNIYNVINSSYSSVLNITIQNHRFSTPKTPKPLVIIKPSHVSHIQAAVICSKSHGLQIRIRSGGHDYEGLSYVAYNDVPYILLDLIHLNDVTVDVESSTAWVQSGATLGELYYKIGEKSPTLGFPAGICPTVGVGGHFSGGGTGFMLRKYGVSADNVIDATLVDANGEFHDRESMGEDLFWAIRGGGGGSFGIVVAWKIKLVYVPPIVTICSATRTHEEDVVKLTHQWQYVAHKLDQNLFLGIFFFGGKSSIDQEGRINPKASFISLFLGEADELMEILNTTFPELGLTKEDCIETSWIESVLYAANGFQNGQILEALLNRSALIPPTTSASSKAKSDYVKQPITEDAIKGMWERLKSQDIETVQIIFDPYGGIMSHISESEIPFPHRAGIMYKIVYTIGWKDPSVEAEKIHLNWIRVLYGYMAPFVTNSPRSAYVNYKDLDIGLSNQNGITSFEQAMNLGLKYFGNNFMRLVHVKTMVDPYDFFRHEQSIPTLEQTCNLAKYQIVE